MKSLKKYVLVALGFALAGMFGAAFGSGPAHALVAALVQIVNTAANPVLTQHVAAENPATQAVWLSCLVRTTPACNLSDSNGTYFVPAGKRLVIDSLSGSFTVTAGVKGLVSYGFAGPGGTTYYFNAPAMYQLTDGGSDFYSWGMSARFYVDSGGSMNMSFSTGGTTLQGTAVSYAYGHLEDIQ